MRGRSVEEVWRWLWLLLFLLQRRASDLVRMGPVMSLTDVVLSVPCPGCHGKLFSFSVRGSAWGVQVGALRAPSLVFTIHSVSMSGFRLKTASSWWCPAPLLSLKKTLFASGVNLTFVLQGQASDKWRFIYSSLIGTTLTLDSLPRSIPACLAVVSDFMTFVRRHHKKQMWARFLLVSVFDRKPGSWLDWWHFVCPWTCSSLDLWHVSQLSKHLLQRDGCQIKVDTLMSLKSLSRSQTEEMSKRKAYQMNSFCLTNNLWIFFNVYQADEFVP